ncbi:jasmonate-induced protein [Zea mays]|uniref:Jasmonate-induced protein n=2 Tax=Zea mays TaxID=4577 RepID=A0A1D6MXJ8_MAIZE|nr:jasmonate-induced protein [Zea mays]ONM33449.1 Jasmonate-induced protein [Zea mays]
MANCFGDIVDNYKLDTMPRYVGKTKTREDRAREASYLNNENEKSKKAKDYVNMLKDWYGNGASTLCVIYNQTGGTLRYIDDKDWLGYPGPTPYPTEIGNGQWASFLHVHKTGAASGSMAAVVYRGKDGGGSERDFAMAWSTPWGASKNRAYCEIGSVGSFQSQWDKLYTNLNKAGYTTNASSTHSSISAATAKGSSPDFKAYVKIPYSA